MVRNVHSENVALSGLPHFIFIVFVLAITIKIRKKDQSWGILIGYIQNCFRSFVGSGNSGTWCRRIYKMFSFSRLMCTRIKQFRLNSFKMSSMLQFTNIALRSRNFTNLTRANALQGIKSPSNSKCMGSLVNVQHDDSKFFIKMDNEIAYLRYNIANGIMYVTHTKVPDKLNGQGLGKLLSKVFVYPSRLP